jgi:hypothetical protein
MIRGAGCRSRHRRYACRMADVIDRTLTEQLEELGAQLVWVREYL